MNDDKKSALKKPLTSPVQVSNAPPPIEPLRGFGGSFRTSSRRAAAKLPNWNYWKTMDEVAIWQACALALDIDPESMTPHPQSWMAPGSDIFTEDSFTSDEQSDSFNKLSRRLNQSLSNKQHFTYAWNHHTCNPAVHLSEFAAWCVRIGMDIPDDLAAMSKGAPQPAAKMETVPVTNPSGDSNNPTGTANKVYWRVILNLNIKEIDGNKKANVRKIIKYLRGLGDKRLPNKGSTDELFWINDMGTERSVGKKTVNNAASHARKLP